jgi:hypothetical protein
MILVSPQACPFRPSFAGFAAVECSLAMSDSIEINIDICMDDEPAMSTHLAYFPASCLSAWVHSMVQRSIDINRADLKTLCRLAVSRLWKTYG